MTFLLSTSNRARDELTTAIALRTIRGHMNAVTRTTVRTTSADNPLATLSLN